MATDEVIEAYGSRAEGLASMLGAAVSANDADRAVIEPWADTVAGRILDVGSGTGRWSGHLAALGHDVVGLEPVERFVTIARDAHPATTAYRWPMENVSEALDEAGFEVIARRHAPGALHASVVARAKPQPARLVSAKWGD